MDVTPLVPQGRQVITGYGNGGFKINHEFVEGSLLLFPDRRLNWHIQAVDQLTLEALLPVIKPASVELLLLGTGSSIAFLDPAIRQALKGKGIAVDVMDTGAACRTYNVLLAEERRIAAALIAV